MTIRMDFSFPWCFEAKLPRALPAQCASRGMETTNISRSMESWTRTAEESIRETRIEQRPQVFQSNISIRKDRKFPDRRYQVHAKRFGERFESTKLHLMLLASTQIDPGVHLYRR